MPRRKKATPPPAPVEKQRTGCQAVQRSDQMNCDACSLVWDVNDPEPPECNLDEQRRPAYLDGGMYAEVARNWPERSE